MDITVIRQEALAYGRQCRDPSPLSPPGSMYYIRCTVHVLNGYVVNIVKIDLTNYVPCYKPNDVMYITKTKKKS